MSCYQPQSLYHLFKLSHWQRNHRQQCNASLINVSDSSNNGTQAVVDPNNNGNASETGENIPTPFNFGVAACTLPQCKCLACYKRKCTYKMDVATPTVNANQFEVEYSSNGTSWTTLAQLAITDPNQGSYQFTHLQIPPGNLYYRIKEIDNDGSYIYSRIVLLHDKTNESGYIVFPIPAIIVYRLAAPNNIMGKIIIELYDAVGRKVLSKQMLAPTEYIHYCGISEWYLCFKNIS